MKVELSYLHVIYPNLTTYVQYTKIIYLLQYGHYVLANYFVFGWCTPKQKQNNSNPCWRERVHKIT